MKKIKFLIISIFLFIILGIFILISLIFSSSVQTEIANSLLRKNFPDGKVGYVSAGLSSAKIDDIELSIDSGVKIKVDSIYLEYDIFSLISKRVSIEDMVVEKCVISCTEKKSVVSREVGTVTSERVGEAKTILVGREISEERDEDKKIKFFDIFPKWDIRIKSAKFDVLYKDSSLGLISGKFSIEDFESEDVVKIKSLSLSGNAVFDNNAGYIQSFRFGGSLSNRNNELPFDLKISSDRRSTPSKDFSLALNLAIRGSLSDYKLLKVEESIIEIDTNFGRMVEVKNAKKFELDLFDISKFMDGELMGINFSIPESFVKFIFPSYHIEYDNSLEGKILLSKRGGDLEAKTIAPIVVKNFSISGNDFRLRDTNICLSMNLIYNGIGLISRVEGEATLKKGEKISLKIENELRANNDLTGGVVFVSISPELISSYLGGVEFSSKRIEGKLGYNYDMKKNYFGINTVEPLGIENICLSNGKVQFLSNMNAEICVNASYMDRVIFDLLNIKLLNSERSEILTARYKGDRVVQRSMGKESSLAIFEVEAKGVPLSILRGLGLDISGNLSSAKAEIVVDKSNYEIEFEAKGDSIFYGMGGKNFVSDLCFDVNSKVSINSDFNSVIDFRKLELEAKGKKILSARGNICFNGNEVTEGKVYSNVCISNLFDQPILKEYNNIHKGDMELETSYSNKKLAGFLRLKDIASKDTKLTVFKLGNANFSLDLRDKVCGEIDLKVKTSRGDTDLKVSGKYDKKYLFNLYSEKFIYEDIDLIKSFFKKENDLVSKAESKSSSLYNRSDSSSPIVTNIRSSQGRSEIKETSRIDIIPFWYFGYNYEVIVKLKLLVSEGENILRNMELCANGGLERFELKRLSTEFLGANFLASGDILFSKARGYDMSKSSINMKGLSLSQFFKETREPMLEGILNGEATLKSAGKDIEGFYKNVYGSAIISSDNGVIRPIDRNSAFGASVGIAGAVIKLGGGIIGERVKEVGAINELLDLLSKINYKKVSAEIERKSDLNFSLKKFYMFTDTMRLDAYGSMGYMEGVAISDQPMKIESTIYIGSKMQSELFAKIGLIRSPESPYKGMSTGPKFEIGGTLSNPKSNLFEVITNAPIIKSKEAIKEDIREGKVPIVNDVVKGAEDAIRRMLKK